MGMKGQGGVEGWGRDRLETWECRSWGRSQGRCACSALGDGRIRKEISPPPPPVGNHSGVTFLPLLPQPWEENGGWGTGRMFSEGEGKLLQPMFVLPQLRLQSLAVVTDCLWIHSLILTLIYLLGGHKSH